MPTVIDARSICTIQGHFTTVSNGDAYETEVTQFLDLVNNTVTTKVIYVDGPLEMRGPILVEQRVARLMDEDAVDAVIHALDPIFFCLVPELEHTNVAYGAEEHLDMGRRFVMERLESLIPIIETFDNAWVETEPECYPAYRFIIEDSLWSIVPRVLGFGVYRRFIRDVPE